MRIVQIIQQKLRLTLNFLLSTVSHFQLVISTFIELLVSFCNTLRGM